MPRTIKADGRIITVPDDATPDEINQIVGPAPKSDTARPEPSLISKVGNFVTNGLNGLYKSGMDTVANVDDLSRKYLPKFMTNTALGFGHPTDIQHEHEIADSAQQNPIQSAFKTVGDVGQFLIPGGGEEKAAGLGAKLLSKTGMGMKIARPLANVATSALGTGLVNKAQGGTFGGGALMGGGGSAVGELGQAAAPTLVGIAQGLKTPYAKTGRAILDETSGILPGQIRKSARGVLDELNPQLNAAADKSAATIPMQPARDIASGEIGTALTQNNPKMAKGIKKMGNQLMERSYEPALGAEGPSAKLPIPEEVPAREYLELKRGIGKAQPQGSWNPESSNAFKVPRNKIYGQMNQDFESAVPEAAPLNRRISALIPATKKPENFFFGHALGPGVGATLGGVGGWRRDGIPGAVEGATMGGLSGLAIPAGMNGLARTLNSPITQRALIPSLVGGTLNATRDKKEERKYSDKVTHEYPGTKLPPMIQDAWNRFGLHFQQGPQRLGGEAVASMGGDPNTVEINNPDKFNQAPQSTKAHETIHGWRKNIAHGVAEKAMPDIKEPYKNAYDSLNGLTALRRSGHTMATIPEEQAATIAQIYTADPRYKQQLQPWMDDIQKTPVSTEMPIDNSSSLLEKLGLKTGTIKTTPRAPGLPTGVPGLPQR